MDRELDEHPQPLYSEQTDQTHTSFSSLIIVSLVILFFITTIVFIFFSAGVSKRQTSLPSEAIQNDVPTLIPSLLPTATPPDTKVDLQADYQNPFEKENQYVNPFSEYKNPFDNL